MTNWIKKGLLAAALVTTAACSTTPNPSFRTEAAPGAPIAQYRTFEWAFDGVPMGTGNSVVYDRVRQALAASLQQAGFVEAAKGNGDMIVAFTIGSRDKIQVTDWGPVGPYWPRYGRRYDYGWSMSYSQTDIRTVTEGSLAVDIFDGQSKHPAWQGIASDRITGSGVKDEQILAAANGLVQRFVAARGQ